MKFFVLSFVCLLISSVINGQQKESLEKHIRKLQSKVDKLELTLKKYSELELRLKETSNALADLNTGLNRTEGELQTLSGEFEKLKSLPQERPSGKISAELKEDVSILETEISFIRQELAKLQEAKAVEKTLSEQSQSVGEGTKDDFKEAISSPWVGFIAFIISIIALFTPG